MESSRKIKAGQIDVIGFNPSLANIGLMDSLEDNVVEGFDTVNQFANKTQGQINAIKNALSLGLASAVDGISIANTLTRGYTYKQLIPGGTYKAGDLLWVVYRATAPGAKTSITNTHIMINSVDDVDTATQLSIQGTSATNRTIQHERFLSIKGATTRCYNTTAAGLTDMVGQPALSTVTIDWSVDQWMFFTIQHTVADQTMFGDFYSIVKMKLGEVNLDEEIPGEEVDFSYFAKKIEGKNKFNLNDPDVTVGFYVFSSGVLSPNAAYTATGFIPAKPSTMYTFTSRHWLSFYDENKVFISSMANAVPNTITTPAGTAFMRTSVIHANIPSLQIEEGSVSTVYESFRYELDSISIENQVEQNFNAQIAIPAKQYFLNNYENSIYFRTIISRWDASELFCLLEGSAMVNKTEFARITGSVGSPIATDLSVTANLYNRNFKIISTKNFQMIAGNYLTDNGALKMICIGDSTTRGGRYVNKAISLIPNVTTDGNVESQYHAGVKIEGRGGWTMNNYHNNIDSPFRNPVSPYKYYGSTGKWTTAGMLAEFSATATRVGGFDGTTGRKLSPAINDCMYNTPTSSYIRWDGSAWVAIDLATLAFTFDFAKYRTTWVINQPDIVTFLLGLNDFSRVSLSSINATLSNWKTQTDIAIASVLADSPDCKIAILLPTQIGGNEQTFNGSTNTTFAKYQNHVMWIARKFIIDNYDQREVEQIYVVDFGSGIDPLHGYDVATELPFSDYTGSAVSTYGTDVLHPSIDGYNQLGVRLAGFIQAIR